jgi:hypothetical protein
MSIDYVAFDAENRDRLSALVTEAKSVLAADDIKDALSKHKAAPRLCTILPSAASEGRLVGSSRARDQREELRLVVIVIAESFGDREDGTAGAYRLIQAVKCAVVDGHGAATAAGWQNSQADGAFVYDGWRFLAREDQRVAYQVEFHANAQEDFRSAA